METQTKKNGAAETKPTTALATQAAAATVTIAPTGEVVRVGFDTLQGFQALQRIGTAFASSSLVPAEYQKNIANCIIAIEMSARMGASPLMVMQNLYLVHGKPSWSSQFLIASFNNCGRFSAIKYRWTGERGKPTWGCTAWAREKDTGEIVEGPDVTMAMAKSEGWIDKKGSKWLTIPQLMLTYRAATFLVRTTAPELTMGLRTVDEMEDIGAEAQQDATTQPAKGVAALKAVLTAAKAAEPAQETPHDPQTGEVQQTAPADDGAPSPEEQREIAEQEAAEAKAQRG